MSSGMNLEQAKEYAKTMTYSQAISNIKHGKGIEFRKATMIKLRELAEIADRLDKADTPQTAPYIPIEIFEDIMCYKDESQTDCDLWKKDSSCFGCYRYDICQEAGIRVERSE